MAQHYSYHCKQMSDERTIRGAPQRMENAARENGSDHEALLNEKQWIVRGDQSVRGTVYQWSEVQYLQPRLDGVIDSTLYRGTHLALVLQVWVACILQHGILVGSVGGSNLVSASYSRAWR